MKFLRNTHDEIILGRFIVKDSDVDDYKDFLNDTMIIPDDFPAKQTKTTHTTVNHDPMKDIILRTISCILRSSNNLTKCSEKNILCLGYRFKRWESDSTLLSNLNVECFFVNTIHSYLMKPYWQLLADRIGELAIRQLLLLPIFMLHDKSSQCYVQVSGVPIQNELYLSRYGKVARKPLIRADDITGDTAVARNKMFYLHQPFIRFSNWPIIQEATAVGLKGRMFKDLGASLMSERLSNNLTKLCDTILIGMHTCNLEKAVRLNCKSALDRLDNDLPSPPVKKKRVRGCRAGKSNRRTKARLSETNWRVGVDVAAPSAQPSDGILRLFRPSRTATVKERLLRRLLRASRRVARLTTARASVDGGAEQTSADTDFQGVQGLIEDDESDDGYITQEEREREKGTTGRNHIIHWLGDDLNTISGYRLHLTLRQMSTECTESSGTNPNQSSPQSFTSTGEKLIDNNLRQAVEAAAAVNFLQWACPHEEVSKCLTSVLLTLLPWRHVWGSRHNKNVFLSVVRRFVSLTKGSSLSVSDIAAGIRLRSIPWLKQDKEEEVDVAVEDADFHQLAPEEAVSANREGGLKRKRWSGDRSANWLSTEAKDVGQQLLFRFLMWIFTDVIMRVLSRCFYVTEGEGSGKQTLYYLRSDWDVLMARAVGRLQEQFVQVDVESNVSDAAVSTAGRATADIPNVRLLPKKSSVRPITNLQGGGLFSHSQQHSKAAAKKYSVRNGSLANCLHALRLVCDTGPVNATGFGVKGLDDIYERLKGFLAQSNVSATPGIDTVYYAAAVDLDKCFDMVDTARLFDIVQSLWQSFDEREGHSDGTPLTVQRYYVSHQLRSEERPAVRTIRIVSHDGSLLSLPEVADALSKRFRDSIVTDSVVFQNTCRKEALELLAAHLFQHVVRIPTVTGHSNVMQIRGIPQGSVLSPLLCNIYYGFAERSCLSEDIDTSAPRLAVRLMDDYLLLSTDRDWLSRLLQRLHTLLQAYGGGINPSKSRVNFDVAVETGGETVALPRLSGQELPWCGLLLDLITLEVRPDWSRMVSIPLRQSLRIDPIRQGVALRRAAKSFFKSKCHVIFFDSAINSRALVIRTVYRMFLTTAMRLHCLAKEGASGSVCRNVHHIGSIVMETVRFGARLVSARCRVPRMGIEPAFLSSRCALSLVELEWLGLAAFIDTLSHRRGLYAKTIRLMLRSQSAREREIDSGSLADMSESRSGHTDLLSAVWL